MNPTLLGKCSCCVLLGGSLFAFLSGCKVQKTGEGENKKVDIETPMGSLHVNTQVDPKDTGMEVYPGATPAEDGDSKHGGNVNIDSSLFGARVVTVKYRSSDPPEKLLEFYRKQLKSFGEVTECRGKVTFVNGRMLCRTWGSGDETNLVTGDEDRRHVVSVKPDGSGSRFVLLYQQVRREKETQ
jgi:hypothetical protein